MVDYTFYVTRYNGSYIPESFFTEAVRDAQAQLDRYKRIYQVTARGPDSENMAVCAMAEALYSFARMQSGALAAGVSVGSVSSSMPQQALPDVTPQGQSRELYRCAQRYLEIYRGPGGASC